MDITATHSEEIQPGSDLIDGLLRDDLRPRMIGATIQTVELRVGSGPWRRVTSRAEHDYEVYYWTLRANPRQPESVETAIAATQIARVRARLVFTAPRPVRRVPREVLDGALRAVRAADERGQVDLASFGRRLAIAVEEPGTGPIGTLRNTRRQLVLPAHVRVITRERHANTRSLELYLRQMGARDCRLGNELGHVGILEDDGRALHVEGKHRLTCARLLGLPVRARAVALFPPGTPPKPSARRGSPPRQRKRRYA